MLMKKFLILLAINILLLGFILRESNNQSMIDKQPFEINKTYVDQNNSQNKIVLYGDYTVEFTNCTSECKTMNGTFNINDDVLKLSIDNMIISF